MAGSSFNPAPNTTGISKPRLSFWEIWNMSFGFLGIQFGFALQNSNVSRIFQTLGADYSNMTILWVAAPITGLFVQPIIGYMSDQTWGKLGRRRPYFLAGAHVVSAPGVEVAWVEEECRQGPQSLRNHRLPRSQFRTCV